MQGTRKHCGRWRRGRQPTVRQGVETVPWRIYQVSDSGSGTCTLPGFWSDTGSGVLARRRVQIAEETLCGWLIEGWLWHVAKGRAERLFHALQDRPVKTLRLSDVGDLAAANAFMPKDLAGHTARFAVMSENEADAHVDRKSVV